jgi:hypothetical protein
MSDEPYWCIGVLGSECVADKMGCKFKSALAIDILITGWQAHEKSRT